MGDGGCNTSLVTLTLIHPYEVAFFSKQEYTDKIPNELFFFNYSE